MSWMQVMIALTIGLLVSAGAMGSALQAEREFCYQYRLPRKNIDIANYLEKVAEGRVKCDRQCLKDARALYRQLECFVKFPGHSVRHDPVCRVLHLRYFSAENYDAKKYEYYLSEKYRQEVFSCGYDAKGDEPTDCEDKDLVKYCRKQKRPEGVNPKDVAVVMIEQYRDWSFGYFCVSKREKQILSDKRINEMDHDTYLESIKTKYDYQEREKWAKPGRKILTSYSKWCESQGRVHYDVEGLDKTCISNTEYKTLQAKIPVEVKAACAGDECYDQCAKRYDGLCSKVYPMVKSSREFFLKVCSDPQADREGCLNRCAKASGAGNSFYMTSCIGQ